jgi:hypothetical protein
MHVFLGALESGAFEEIISSACFAQTWLIVTTLGWVVWSTNGFDVFLRVHFEVLIAESICLH